MTSYAPDQFDQIPKKHYGLILADPPWRFKSYAAPKPDAKGRRDTERHYPTMSIADIKALDVKSIAAPNCHLMLWCSWPFLPDGLDVLKAWGFKYSSSFKVWVKTKKSFSDTRLFATLPDDFHTGTGHTTRKNSEFILLGRRGSPKKLTKAERELMFAPVREHSRKPDDTIVACERYAPGPYMEFFARTERPGWDAFGNEVQKFEQPKPPEPIFAPLAEPEQADIFDEVA